MPQHTLIVEQTVLAAMSAACTDKSIAVAPETEVLEVVDSLGFFTALTDIQDVLGLSLEPPQILQLFRCRTIEDMIAALENF